MRYKRTSILPYMTCCICGKKVGRYPVGSYFGRYRFENYETVITKRNTEVVFHKDCYKEMLMKQREGV